MALSCYGVEYVVVHACLTTFFLFFLFYLYYISIHKSALITWTGSLDYKVMIKINK